MTNAEYTHLAVIADRSGSMASIRDDMNEGLKTFLEEQDKMDGVLKVDITTFDSTVDTVATDSAVADIEHPVIWPRGMTALNDGLGRTVTGLGERLSKMKEEDRPSKVIVLVITDGGENSSHEFTTADVKKLVEEQQEKYDWEFIFLGANIDSFSVAGGYGISANSTIQYVASAAGATSVLRGASEYVTRSRLGESTSFTDAERAAAGSN